MVITTSGWRGDPLVTTVAAPSFLVPLPADPYEAMVVRLHWRFRLALSARPVIPGTVVTIHSL